MYMHKNYGLYFVQLFIAALTNVFMVKLVVLP